MPPPWQSGCGRFAVQQRRFAMLRRCSAMQRRRFPVRGWRFPMRGGWDSMSGTPACTANLPHHSVQSRPWHSKRQGTPQHTFWLRMSMKGFRCAPLDPTRTGGLRCGPRGCNCLHWTRIVLCSCRFRPQVASQTACRVTNTRHILSGRVGARCDFNQMAVGPQRPARRTAFWRSDQMGIGRFPVRLRRLSRNPATQTFTPARRTSLIALQTSD